MAGETVTNGRAHDETRKRLAESRSLQRVTAALLQKLTLEQVLGIVRQEARNLTGASGGGDARSRSAHFHAASERHRNTP